MGDATAGGRDDGGVDVEPDAPPEDAGPALCDPSDQTLRACYTFDGTTEDGSSYNNDAATSSPSFTAGRRGGALVTTTGTITVGATTSLNVSALTIRMWIKANTLPTGVARMGLVDSGNRYRMFVVEDGKLRCAFTNGPTLTTPAAVVTPNTWHRVACTYNAVEMKLFVDGVQVALLNSTQAIPTATNGMVIGHNNPTGENFDGAIDELQLFGAIVTP